jgi:hypothetical protein
VPLFSPGIPAWIDLRNTGRHVRRPSRQQRAYRRVMTVLVLLLAAAVVIAAVKIGSYGISYFLTRGPGVGATPG